MTTSWRRRQTKAPPRNRTRHRRSVAEGGRRSPLRSRGRSLLRDSSKIPRIATMMTARNPAGVDEIPKKRGRGRSSISRGYSSARAVRLTHPSEFTKDDNAPSRTSAEKHKSTNSDQSLTKTSQPATEIPTPSPEKTGINATATPPKEAKRSPTSHSPIKGSSTMPLRVGLSKRYRIPPLLRTMHPPKR